MTTTFKPEYVVCPICRSREFLRDQPWKRVCLSCYFKAKGTTEKAAPTKPTTPAIDAGMLRRLIQLCHPDRHSNSEASTIATRFLLGLRRE
jgi:hypothetical protein